MQHEFFHEFQPNFRSMLFAGSVHIFQIQSSVKKVVSTCELYHVVVTSDVTKIFECDVY